MFSLSSRYCKRLSLPISLGMVFSWFRSSHNTLRLASRPIKFGISSISLLPKSSVSSFWIVHKESGMVLSKLSLPCNVRRFTKLKVRCLDYRLS